MTQSGTKKLVLLGMMTRMPVGGVIWQTLHYLLGFQRLGYEVYYVEMHGRPPFMLMEKGNPDPKSREAAAVIDAALRRFDLGDRWAYFALHDDSHCYGLGREQVTRLFDSAALIVNLHGGTKPTPELARTGRLVYVETDPVQLQVELHDDHQESFDFLEAHCAFFTFGENYGRPSCKLPVSDRFAFHPTRQPVLMDFWEGRGGADPRVFTTVGNWKQPWREVVYEGDVYSWSKHYEFEKFLDLPSRTSQPLELALGSYDEDDRRLLAEHGWTVRPAPEFSMDADSYRDYITSSRGEFTVAKDQNVRLRSGWFSDRSATYLAAGRPVISQETGFSEVMPTGEGLFAFSTIEEVIEALDRVNADYALHSRRASEIARECFSHDVVLGRLLSEVGEERAGRRGRLPRFGVEPFPASMDLEPVSRRPTRLDPETVEIVTGRPVPVLGRDQVAPTEEKLASIVIVSYDNLVFTRLCLESLLANTDYLAYEVIVVDNGSRDGSLEYLRRLAEQHTRVRLVINRRNVGFASACNQGLALAGGEVLVLLNNDTMVPPGWLRGLVAQTQYERIGLVGAVTNRIGNEAEVPTSYRTWGECLAFARNQALTRAGETLEIGTVTMFCMAMRRDVHRLLGPLDTQFEVGTLEDDDYSMRARAAGLKTICADDVFVHHFGEASFGKLIPTGEYADVLTRNKERFEQKWGRPWEPYRRRPSIGYASLTERVQQIVAENVPRGATVLVVSKGDDNLVRFDGWQAKHFPATEDGRWVGHHPADTTEAVALLEAARQNGGSFFLLPKTGFWWLEYYEGLEQHLLSRYDTVVRDDNTCVLFALDGER
jgi:GT2 family glycosyltransferase